MSSGHVDNDLYNLGEKNDTGRYAYKETPGIS